MFKPISSKVSFTELERRILQFWKENRVFERSVEERAGAPLFVLYEGPPTANASPGVHHVLARVFKDVIPRYKTMKGYRCPRKAGWDTHGLPVELEVERELGFTSKAEIEAYGVTNFNAKCRQSVFRYVKEWNELTGRIAFWVDTDHPYITLDNGYIESCWWVVKQLWDKGLIYQGYRVTPHCPRCGTSLSSHEVALGYDETDDPSVYVKFKVAKSLYQTDGFLDSLRRLYGERVADFAEWLLKLSGDKPVFLLAWTTTPWTLPGNTALAVSPGAGYSILEGDADCIIMASALVEMVGLEGYREAAKVTGSELVDLRYEPLFNPSEFSIAISRFDFSRLVGLFPEAQEPSSDFKWKPGGTLNYPVIAADFVSLEDGTGIVHVAPAFGEVDFEAGQEKGLDFVRDYVDLQGVIRGTYPFAGRFVKDADPLILHDLKERGLLYRSETIRHTYPFCWRCRTPLLYYAKQSWYIKTTVKKDLLIQGNEEINWYPEHIKHGRFGDWLENNVDWAVSRERYWGTPLPVWRCESCGSDECIGSIAELKSRLGLSIPRETLDLHRPYVDQVFFSCPQCGGRMRRQPDVLDAWFDSGAMPVAQWHYPFENQDTFEKFFPADYICEAIDQTRGWFYTLHALSTLLFDQPCFRNVICLGHILDAQGEKMSKSKGNVVNPWTVIDRHGADALRWYLITSSPAGSVRRFSAELVEEGLRRFLLTLWNVYSFFVTYANIDRFDPRKASDFSPTVELDRWILSELNQLVQRVDRSLANYDPTDAGRAIGEFVDDLSNWYVRRSRRRFWKSENDADKMAAHATLYQSLVTLARLLAPFTPFIAEELYQNLVRPLFPDEPLSVHLATFPAADPARIDEQLTQDIHLAMKVCSLGRAARSKAGIKVRQPLAEARVSTKLATEREGLKHLLDQVAEELNVKNVSLLDPGQGQALLSDPAWSVAADDSYTYHVAIHIVPTPELADEGIAREIVHRLQTMRKDAGFDIADYIETYYHGSEVMRRVMTRFAPYVKQETLSRQLSEGIPPDVYQRSHRIAGEEILLGVRKVGNTD